LKINKRAARLNNEEKSKLSPGPLALFAFDKWNDGGLACLGQFIPRLSPVESGSLAGQLPFLVKKCCPKPRAWFG
jgi:hypothetical protein